MQYRPSKMSAEGRFKRSLFGYRPREVDEAIANRDAELEACRADLARRAQRIEELDQVSARLAERVVERQRELRQLRADLERVREQRDESQRTMAALAGDLEAVRRQARGQATRIRMRALREAADLVEQIGELARRPDEARERLIESLEQAIARVGAEGEEEGSELASLADPNGHGGIDPAELFEGLVEVEVGPLNDFSQLVGFEDAANGIGATSEISVKRFTQGRATLAMRFKQPVALLRELEQRAPFDFKVRDTGSDRVVLDVDEDSASR
jgi:hypothetical protein